MSPSPVQFLIVLSDKQGQIIIWVILYACCDGLRRNGALFRNVYHVRQHYHNIEHCLIDISVFIGARSNLGATTWVWNNGTTVVESTYGTTPLNVCQQMSVPLTYENGINMLPKNCDSDEAYFICETKPEIKGW